MDTAQHPNPCTPETSAKLTNMALFCACLVVFIHIVQEFPEGSPSWWCYHLLRDGLARIAVPFFFIASGYFLAGNTATSPWYKREITKRIKSLFIPYLLWNTLHLVYFIPIILIANILAHAPLSRNLAIDGGMLLTQFGLNPYHYPGLVPLWFVRNLFFLVLLSPILIALLKWKRIFLFALPTLLWLAWGLLTPWHSKPETPEAFWSLTFSLSGLFHFTLGITLRYIPIKVNFPPVIAFILGMGGFILRWALELKGIIWAPHLQVIAIPLTLYAVWQWMPKRILFPRLSTVAFPIYLIHIFILNFIALTLSQLNLTHCAQTLTGYFLVGGVAIAGSILLALGLQRFFPKTASLLFGGRVTSSSHNK